MALHSDLSIHQTGMELLKVITKIVVNMERDYKTLVGQQMFDTSLFITVLVYRANVAEDKVPAIGEIIEGIRSIEALVRVCLDGGKVTDRQYMRIARLAESVSKQAVGWKKQSARNISPFHGGRQSHHD